jgi:DNA-binding CsgD family transcriptional regulator
MIPGCNTSQKELEFLRKIIDKSPAIMGIQEISDPDDPTTNHNLWTNHKGLEFLGYSREELDALGHILFIETMHPDDMEMIGIAMNKMGIDENISYGGVYRLRPKGKDFKWVIGSIIPFESRNGKPWRFLNVTLDIDGMKDTQNQIIALTREIRQLKNQIKINTLTRREKQIIGLIASGWTDKEIGKRVYISPSTAKTHRNNIHRKLGLKNTAAIVQFAIENELMPK